MTFTYDSTSPKLRWAPPVQTSPTIVSVPDGFYDGSFGPNEDVIFNWPADSRFSEFIATGGRHMRIIGGASAKGPGGSAIQITGCTGSVFVEGLAIDVSGSDLDAINICGDISPTYANFPDVYIQNCRLLGINGSEATNHSDGWQAQGSVGNLFMDCVTLTSNDQGISLFQNQFPTRAAYISRVNCSYTNVTGDPVTYLFWNMDENTSAPYKPVFVDQVYFAPRSAQNLSQCIWPAAGTVNNDSIAIGATTTNSWATATFPAITNCTGTFTSGVPAGGDWAKSAAVGLGYVSPGYQGSYVQSTMAVGGASSAVTIGVRDSVSFYIKTADNEVTVVAQISQDGNKWYDILQPDGSTLLAGVITQSTPGAVNCPGLTGRFIRLLCVDAPDGPATVTVSSR